MLFFTRWKAAAILLTAFVVCLFAVPNFFPEQTVKNWPTWAQRHLVLGLDLQGGSHLLLEVDTNAVRKEVLQALEDDVLRLLREARIPFTGRAIRGNHVEVHITRDNDVQTGADEASRPVAAARRHPRWRRRAHPRYRRERRPHHAHPDAARDHRADAPGGRPVDPDH